MCGIAGYLQSKGLSDLRNAELIGKKMAAAIAHRGPDQCGTYILEDGRLALVHRRLAILDLSAAGDQPMHSRDGRWVLSYNGEIYNFRDMRLELELDGYIGPWRGHSDTEVLLAGFSTWGFRETLERANGMFSLAAIFLPISSALRRSERPLLWR